MNWFEFVPASLSAIATVAAAVAAFFSLRVSKQAIRISESSALASHHQSASIKYTTLVQELLEASSGFSEICYGMWVDWPKELEVMDDSGRGGTNPRPLRHVVSDSSEMLANYGSKSHPGGRVSSSALLSVVRHGLPDLSEEEYLKLLDRADGEYQSFESTFGATGSSRNIETSPAFRWGCYQLLRRVEPEDWSTVWKDAWLPNGWIDRYKTEYVKLKPTLERAHDSLKLERSKLAHTAFPLGNNPVLSKRYDEVLAVLDNLLHGCDDSVLDPYKNWTFEEEMSQLVICSMAIGVCAHRQCELLYKKANE